MCQGEGHTLPGTTIIAGGREVKGSQARELFRLQLVERPGDMVEARAIGYAHALAALPFDLDELAGLLADGLYAEVGQALYGVLFPEGEVRDSLAEALVVSRAERRPLTMQLHLDAASPALAHYPWELVHDGQSFLVADGAIALARYVDSAPALTPARVEMPLRILVVSPRPVNLASPTQRSAALAALEPLRQRGLVHVDVLTPPTYAALRQVLSSAGYEILHFDGPSGYGLLDGQDPQAYLVFEDEQAGAFPVAGATLHNALFLSQLRLAVLTPPFVETARPRYLPALTSLAGLAPALVKAGVPAVVAMQYPLSDEQNGRFAAQLYRSLAERAPLGTAVAHARGQLLPPEGARFVPAVYLQDAQSTGELFVGPAAKAAPRELAHVPTSPGRTSAGYRADPVFVDRAQAVQQALAALAEPGVRVCIWGLGGVGKTAVAQEVVRRGAWRFPGGIVWLGLQGGRSLASILSEIADFCSSPPLAPRLEEATHQVTTLLAEQAADSARAMLLVLDNLEDAAADADLQGFVAALPAGVRVLATSRIEPAGGRWQSIELRAMGAEDIEEILRRRIQALGIQVQAADEPLLAEISALLDGYPLGVDLVASLARTCSWQHIRDQLRAQPPPPLQAILRTTVAEALDDAGRRVASRLSVFRGPFDRAAVARLAGNGEWLPQVQRLRELALVSFDGHSYGFDAPVREYLYGLLEPDDAQACHELAYRHFAGRRDLDGLVEAYQHAMAAGQHEAARRLLRDKLIDPMLAAGRYRQLRRLLDQALARPETFDERFLLGRATVQRTLGQLAEAMESLEQVLAVPDLTAPSRALALHEQGRLCYELDDEALGDHQQALDLYAQALAICEDLAAAGADRAQRRWLNAELAALFQDIALLYQHALARPADLAFARQLYAASAGFWQRLRDAVSRAVSEKQRAEILRTGSKEERSEAKRIYRQVMQTFRRKGLQRDYGDVLLPLGQLYQDERSYKHALRRFQEYEEIQRRLGLEREEAIAWKHQGEIHQEAGYRGRSVKRAIELYGRTLERLADYRDRWSRRTVVATYLRRGEVQLELGLAEQATDDFRAALLASIAMGTRGGAFAVQRLSAADRRRLAWAACALARTSTDGDGEGESPDDLQDAVLATCRSLAGQGGPATCQELDCRHLIELPGWAKHHQAGRTRRGR